jgi:hypothetical protein
VAAFIALPPSVLAVGLAINEILTPAEPGTAYFPPRGVFDAALGVAAVIVATALGWWLADRVDASRMGFQWRLVIGYALLCDVAGAVVVSALISVTSLGAPLQFLLSVPILTFDGLLFFGLPGLLVILPCAWLWVWLMRRSRTTASP